MQTFGLDDTQLERLHAYADAVRASPHNLLSRRALDELWDRHIAESVAFARQLPAGDDRRLRLLDVGTGGGLPGFVVAIVRPDLEVTLLDATAKKIAFLEETARSLELSVDTITGRAEEVARERAGSFDLVTARAVAGLEQLVRWCLPFLRPGGELHAIKGDRWRDELRQALATIEAFRATVIAVPEGPGAPVPTDGRDEGEPVQPRVVTIRAAG